MSGEPFIDATELKNNLEKIKTIDIRPYQKYVSGHIPRSIWIWFWDFTKHKEGKPSNFKSVSELAQILSKYGICRDDHVVIVYDMGTIGLATYTFWLLEYMGQENIQLLNGGIDEWIRRGYTVEKGVHNPDPCRYIPKVRDSIRATIDDVKKLIKEYGSDKPLLLDVRTVQEYKGTVKTTPRAGRIPRSILTPPEVYINILTSGLRKSLNDEALKLVNEIKRRGAITYCATGERASFAWFVLYKVLKISNVKLYPESFYEYSSYPDLPIEKD